MESVRPAASRGRSTVGWLQTMLHRRRGVRWIAAAGAAAAAFAALNSAGADAPSLDTAPGATARPTGAADLLAPNTRGVPVPGANAAFRVGDIVDIHEIRTGAAVAHGALVVESGESETIVAVPVERVDAVIDALTTGGVILALAPTPAGPAPT